VCVVSEERAQDGGGDFRLVTQRECPNIVWNHQATLGRIYSRNDCKPEMSIHRNAKFERENKWPLLNTGKEAAYSCQADRNRKSVWRTYYTETQRSVAPAGEHWSLGVQDDCATAPLTRTHRQQRTGVAEVEVDRGHHCYHI